MSKVFKTIKNYRSEIFRKELNGFETIDMHTGGEPLRVIMTGIPEFKSSTVLGKRREMIENHDHIRQLLMFEPRGHADMYGCILTEPNDDTGDLGVIFMHNEGYSTMCGHAIIAITKLVFSMGWKQNNEGINSLLIDAPCGRIKSLATVSNDKIEYISFHCVPSFVIALDRIIKIPEIGPIQYDIAYGGAFYAYVDLEKNEHLNIHLEKEFSSILRRLGMIIKRAIISRDNDIIHPFEEELSYLYGTIFIGEAKSNKHHSRNVCIFADGEIDRCPTGSGVSGRMAIHQKRSDLDLNEKIIIESITDSLFTGSYISTEKYGQYDAVIPKVSGVASITGYHTFILEEEDLFKTGFLMK